MVLTPDNSRYKMINLQWMRVEIVHIKTFPHLLSNYLGLLTPPGLLNLFYIVKLAIRVERIRINPIVQERK